MLYCGRRPHGPRNARQQRTLPHRRSRGLSQVKKFATAVRVDAAQPPSGVEASNLVRYRSSAPVATYSTCTIWTLRAAHLLQAGRFRQHAASSDHLTARFSPGTRT